MKEPGAIFAEIDAIFHPRSVAVVGASDRPQGRGRMFLVAMDNGRFRGELYAIHPKERMQNYRTYPRVSDVPGPVDHVIVSVPARPTLEVIEDCGKKGVRSASLFTSGFAEEGDEKSCRLQQRLVSAAARAGVRLIGPNCMGLFCPESGLSFRADLPLLDGELGIVAQSGGICMTVIYMTHNKGMGVSKAVSYGNEGDMTAAEFLYYLAEDAPTRAILLYVEGCRDGASFLRALEYAAKRKPVVMLKGGTSADGVKAVSSHTGSMAGSSRIWEAVARQAGVPVVPDMDELVDGAQAFLRMKRPAGKRVALITISGGFGVFATDILARRGLQVSPFSRETEEVLGKLIKRAGTSVDNPLDMASTFHHFKKYPKVLGALDADPSVDMFVLLLATEYLTMRQKDAMAVADMVTGEIMAGFANVSKPVAVVFFQTTMDEKRMQLERRLIDAGYPVFPTVERCADALSRRLATRW
jgi:acyl-CoA synthetase (NDP forming)